VALVFFDLDHFKQVNDTHGHAVGDRVLVETVAAVRRVCRTMDMVGRWGGEEFVVLAPNTGLDGATILAERLRRALAALDLPQVGSISASFGVAACHGTDTLESWLERADRAAYRAKRGGRNRVEVATTPSGDGATVEHVHAGFVQLVWSPAYASGHPVIDGQHQGLFRRANDLFDAVLYARPADEADAALDALVRDLVTHFQDEERIILQVGYPDTARHARVHAILLARTDERIQAFRGHRSGIGDLIGFLAHDVVLHHLLAEDRRFFPYLA
jgi:diguanylate cyclase (GGDEF)-like protein/hemerythrin-like metal-binding protein